MDFSITMLLLVIFLSGGVAWFLIRWYFEKKIEKVKVYHEALRIFYRWKSEIGGVSLKGVWQHYEKWILQKIQEVSNNAPDNTKKQPRKNTE